jgi:hypothetical protein
MTAPAILEREAVSLIRENLSEAVAAHALRESVPGSRGWKVSLSTVDGSEFVLRTGLTADFAQRLAVEASSCILTLRTGREYPEDRIDLPPCTATSQGVTIELQEGAIAYRATDGSTPAPAWRPDVAARLEALRNMTLRQLAENKLIPAEAWRRLGAAKPVPMATVYWRQRGKDHRGRPLAAREYHLAPGTSQLTLCGQAIPSREHHEVYDSRSARVYAGLLEGCPLCVALRDKGARS